MTSVVPATSCSTLGDRAFPVSAAWTWNAVPSVVTAASSLASFRQKLKHTHFLSHHFLMADSNARPVCLYNDPVTVITLIAPLWSNNNIIAEGFGYILQWFVIKIRACCVLVVGYSDKLCRSLLSLLFVSLLINLIYIINEWMNQSINQSINQNNFT